MKIIFLVFSLIICFNCVNSQRIVKCQNNKKGNFPECDCVEKNHGFDTESLYPRCLPICPSISKGIYPNCTCRYGTYSDKNNTCLDSRCPTNTSPDSVYPNCKCMGKNYIYNEYLNECYLDCPEDSTGHYPDCKCEDERKGFNNVLFECTYCPAESTEDSIYPNCETNTIVNATFDSNLNVFKRCQPAAFGKWPDCKCHNGNVYRPRDDKYYKEGCSYCQWQGEYPDCKCYKKDDVFDGTECTSCWKGGKFPNCNCDKGETYDAKRKKCKKCPADSVGEYPNCVCSHPKVYVNRWDKCISCPDDASGVFPNCTCTSEKAGFIERYNNCEYCPDNFKGRFPNCECENKTHIYDDIYQKCGTACEFPSFSVHPNCHCENHFKSFYDRETGKCTPYTYPGRACPPNAIGRSPHCYCVQKGYFFVPYAWGCFNSYKILDIEYRCVNSDCGQSVYGIDHGLLFDLAG